MQKNMKIMAMIVGIAMIASVGLGGVAYSFVGSGNWTNLTANTPGLGWPVDTAMLSTVGNTGRIVGGSEVDMTTAETIAALQLGFNTPGTLNIKNGGSLTANSTTYIGNTGAGTMNVNSGGTFTAASSQIVIARIGSGVLNVDAGGTVITASHLWAGLSPSESGTINVDGTLKIGANFALGSSNGSSLAADGAAGYLNVNDGGAFIVENQSYDGSVVFGSSLITLSGTGYISYMGNSLANVNADILAGKIVSGDGVVTALYDGANTIIAVPEPATVGLFAVFGGALLLVRRIRNRNIA